MTSRVYSKIKQYIKENYPFLITLVILTILFYFPVPYYIDSTGGLINVSDKVSVEDGYKDKGTFNLAYVTEMRGKVITYLFSFIMKDWDLIKKQDIQYSNETVEDVDYRNHMLLDEANQNALIVAYTVANKYVNVLDSHNYIVYIDKIANTDLKIRDEILSVNGKAIRNTDDYIKILSGCSVGDKLSIKVKDANGNTKDKYIEVKELDKSKITGIYIVTKDTIKTEPNIKFSFDKSESGPSGGFMMSLAIYSKLINVDISHGLKIVGTGTIDIHGNVGEIGGVKYKLKGAEKEHADIFFVPEANYKEALEEKEANNYKVKIISINTFKDALNYLEEYKS